MCHCFYRHIVIRRIEAVRNEDRILGEFSSDIKATGCKYWPKRVEMGMLIQLCVQYFILLYLETTTLSMFSSFDIIP